MKLDRNGAIGSPARLAASGSRCGAEVGPPELGAARWDQVLQTLDGGMAGAASPCSARSNRLQRSWSGWGDGAADPAGASTTTKDHRPEEMVALRIYITPGFHPQQSPPSLLSERMSSSSWRWGAISTADWLVDLRCALTDRAEGFPRKAAIRSWIWRRDGADA